ncbi:MAG: HD-GYP domain-containing protein [Ilumatobacter sp.]
MAASSPDSLRPIWVATWAVPAVIQIGLAMSLAPDIAIGSPMLLFSTVVLAASLCVVAAVWASARAFRTGEADLGLLGGFFFPVSVLPLVHGLTTPDVLYGPNAATGFSVFVAIPVGLAVIAPFALRHRIPMTTLRRHWRRWIISWVVATSVFASFMLAAPDSVPNVRPSTTPAVAVALASFVGCILASRRHLHLARISGRRSSLVVPAGYGLVGASAFVWLIDTPLSFGFWLAHVLDIGGVFAATIGALVVYRRSESVRSVLAPVMAVEPLGALEAGLDPVVHRFVAELESKDVITRDHVVRTATLAVAMGERLNLGATELRRLGLTALLHDVGKLEVPTEIIDKPGRLTDDEYEVIKRHPLDGERLVASTMAEIGSGIRGHHERIDGGGYPDGLTGDEIPFDARIVAVCDAFDAMANTRQYRDGMGADRALAILREHAGSQWDAALVDTLVELVERDGPALCSAPLDKVGRRSEMLRDDLVGHIDPDSRNGDDEATPMPVGCDCLPAMSR